MRPFNLIKSYRLVFISIIVSVLMLGTALWYRSQITNQRKSYLGASFDVNSVLPPAPPNVSQPQQTISASKLAENNGKNGNKCYVAVDTIVYEIEQKLLWKDGQHSTSGGQAMCGKDMTEVIKKSPHGHSKLEGLSKVGTYIL